MEIVQLAGGRPAAVPSPHPLSCRTITPARTSAQHRVHDVFNALNDDDDWGLRAPQQLKLFGAHNF